MKKKTKALVTIFLSLMLVLMNVLGSKASVFALESAEVINPNPENIILVPGETRTLKIPIKSVGFDIYNASMIADTFDTPYTVTAPIIVGESSETKLNMIREYSSQYIEFEVSVEEAARIGKYPINIMIYGIKYSLDGVQPVSYEFIINTQILNEKETARLSISNATFDSTIIGKDTKLSLSIMNDGELAARKVFASVDYPEGIIAGYSDPRVKIDDIEADKKNSLSLPIKILPTASPGLKTVTINLTYKSDGGDTVTESHDIYLSLTKNDKAPELNLNDFSYNVNAKPGEMLDLEIDIINNGKSTAVNPRIYVDEASVGTAKFIKDYYTDYIAIQNIKADQTAKKEIPLIVSKRSIGGEYDIKLNLVYFDGDGVEYNSSVTIYLNIEAEGVTEDGTPIVLISNVLQSPQKPVAGERLEISFDMVNKSAVDLDELKISLKDLTGNTFIPVESEPYQYLGKLKGGESKRITIPLTVSEDIQEGLNNLLIGYSYIGGEDSISIPVLDVQNDFGSASKPRLIISKYEADIDELRAGSVFNLNLDIHNTHSSVAAKNIIITVSGRSDEGVEVFSVTQGSNSFFVNKIAAGETISKSLEMKVKSDTATKAYPVGITIEYEYDGIKADQDGKIGDKEELKVNLQVIENARPVVDYVNVYSWDGGVTVGSPATLAFEFYNMGKSMLNNVIATVEGDFTNSSGNMYFMGNVMAGDRSYAEFEVIPNIEGIAYGLVKITYEDSNGDEQVYTKEFESHVMGEQIWDPGMNGDGGMDVFNPSVPEPKKAILPTWMFIAIQVLIFIVFLLVSRKVIINIYKSKLRKKEDQMY